MGVHLHEHAHSDFLHSHPHDHDAFIKARPSRARDWTLASRLATVAVPFGVAASPDLTILPVALAASAYGGGAVVSVLGMFAGVTMAVFVSLTVRSSGRIPGQEAVVGGPRQHDHLCGAVTIGVVAFI